MFFSYTKLIGYSIFIMFLIHFYVIILYFVLLYHINVTQANNNRSPLKSKNGVQMRITKDGGVVKETNASKLTRGLPMARVKHYIKEKTHLSRKASYTI